MDLTPRLAAVRARIAAAGDVEAVRLIAVSKGFGAGAVDAAIKAGVVDIGESYAQELVAKAAEVREQGVRWHFIGRLQTNKVRSVATLVDLWHTVDRASLGDEVAKRAPGATVLLQVNVSDEPQKGGCGPQEASALVRRLRHAGLQVEGLMAIGVAGSPDRARSGFRRLRHMADDLGLAECSMGMSDDLEIAVEEGSTMVRIGRALFGDRPRPDAGDPPN